MKIYIAYIAGVVLILAAVVWLGSRSSTPTTSSNDPNKPIAKVEETSFDLGTMSVKDIKEHNFTIINDGKSELTLNNVMTSCDCTYVYIIKADKTESPKFTMHGDNSWKTSIQPGQSATVRVVYEPAIMPVFGAVERFVMVATNDPDHQKLEFKITAQVAE